MLNLFKRPVKITKIQKDQRFETQDVVLVEAPIDLIVNSQPLVNIICLPNDLKELAIGFLFSIGIINSINDVKDLKINEGENTINISLRDSIEFNAKKLEVNPVGRVIETSCGISSPWRNIIKESLDAEKSPLNADKSFKIPAKTIFQSIQQLQIETSAFKETGGCHGAAAFDKGGNLLTLKEDIGRHNALDKVIGDLIIKKRDLGDIYLTSTGRLTGDSVLKAIRARSPILASPSAPIESGIRLAFAYGLTLIGFVRGSKMNIYAHPDRII